MSILVDKRKKISKGLRKGLFEFKCPQRVRDIKEASEFYLKFLDVVHRVLHSTVRVKRPRRSVSDKVEVRRVMRVRDNLARILLIRLSEKPSTTPESVQKSITHLERGLGRNGFFD